MSEFVDTDQKGAIFSIALNRPEKKNAITSAMYGALADALNKAATDEGVRVVLLRGEGGTTDQPNAKARQKKGQHGAGEYLGGQQMRHRLVKRFGRSLKHLTPPPHAKRRVRQVVC